MSELDLKSTLCGEVMPRNDNHTCRNLVAGQIYKNAQAVAIVQGEKAITYAEFGELAAGFAKRLSAGGVSKGQLVPIVTSGGINMIVSMYALWLLDAAFAPVDVCTPPARLSYILETLGGTVIIADDENASIEGYETFCVNAKDTHKTDWSKLYEVSETNDHPIAYGFFTSGSTGEPKCCLNVHSGLANRILHMSERLNLGVGEAVLQNSSHIFDSSLWQIFWPLSVGASVVIPNRSSALDMTATIAEIQRRNVIITDFVPSIYEKLLQLVAVTPEKLSKLKSLRYLVVGGESVNSEIVARSHKLLPWVELINTYGPTEASIGMVFHRFAGDEGAEIPLGTPIANTQLAVVDEALNLVERGDIGEIVISGACLGLGYLNNKEQTDMCFVTNPGIPELSDRIYRTGDMGRVDKNGLVYFHGREGDQLKLAGVRIELGEIEHHLRNIDGIDQVKVVIVNNKNQRYLAGFFSASRDVGSDEIKTYLKDRLASVSIPKVLRQLNDFPRTPSGKIDGKKLALGEATKPVEADETGTLAERVLHMCEMFCPEPIHSENENLADFGIDSLGLLSLSFKLQEAFKKPVAFEDIVANPTVSGIISLLGQPALKSSRSEAKAKELKIVPQMHKMVANIRAVKKVSSDMPLADTILLTGASGYVGANLLAALDKTTNWKIICLVRAKTDKDAQSRLLERVDRVYGLTVDWSRITAIACDLKKLSDPDVISRIIQHRPKCIVHAAAEVDFLKDFDALYLINVEATLKLCEIAMALDIERFHYVSSMGIAGVHDQNVQNGTGYVQTKWVSDTIIQTLTKTGFRANIYRLGEMMPDESCIRPNELAASTILIKASLALNAAPDLDEWLDYTPVTRVADFIATRVAADLKDGTNMVQNLWHPNIQNLVDVIQAASGDRNMVRLDRARFIDELKSRLSSANSKNEDVLRRAYMLMSYDKQLFRNADTNIDEHFQSYPLLWPHLNAATLLQMTTGFRAS